MPRRPASVTQADISRAIRAAKESGAGEVTIDSSGTIHIALEPKPDGTQQKGLKSTVND